ncbi:MAG: hypothetical protein WCD45_09775 [Gallionella sp.]
MEFTDINILGIDVDTSYRHTGYEGHPSNSYTFNLELSSLPSPLWVEVFNQHAKGSHTKGDILVSAKTAESKICASYRGAEPFRSFKLALPDIKSFVHLTNQAVAAAVQKTQAELAAENLKKQAREAAAKVQEQFEIEQGLKREATLMFNELNAQLFPEFSAEHDSTENSPRQLPDK